MTNDFRLWVVLRREPKNHPIISGVECYGLFESEQEAKDAAQVFMRDEWVISVHEVRAIDERSIRD